MISEALVEKERFRPRNDENFDLIVIGAGPAGMSAALCACRAKLKTLIIERAVPGGQASTAYVIDNYLGFAGGIFGDDLGRRMEAHLEGHGCYSTFETVEDIEHVSDFEKIIRTNMGHMYKTKAVIVAVGLEPKKLGASFESKFLGRGISYYAQGDASFYKGKDVAVIGGGNCACYAAEYLSQYVNNLYLIHQSDDIKAVKSLKEKIMNNPKVQIIWNSRIDDVFGIEKIEKIKIVHGITEQHTWIDVKGVFIYTGRIPPREILSLNIETDTKGFIVTDDCMRTNLRGVYAVGDIRVKQVRQIATAVADGMIAAVNVERDLQRIIG
jgi:thioredoxin reductase (NADPH)